MDLLVSEFAKLGYIVDDEKEEAILLYTPAKKCGKIYLKLWKGKNSVEMEKYLKYEAYTVKDVGITEKEIRLATALGYYKGWIKRRY